MKPTRSLHGQIALFMVLGVFLVVLLALTYSWQKVEFTTSPPDLSPGTSEGSSVLTTAVESCLSLRLEREISRIAQLNWHPSSSDLETIPAVDLTTNPPHYASTIHDIEAILAGRIEHEMPECLKDSISAPWKKEIGTPKVKVQILPAGVDATAMIPTTIFLGSTRIQQDTFAIHTRIPLYSLIETYRDIIDEAADGTPGICISCLTKKSEDRNHHITKFDIDDNQTLFITTHDTARVDGQPLKAMFIIHHGGRP